VLFSIGNTTNIYEDRLKCAALGISTTAPAFATSTASTATAPATKNGNCLGSRILSSSDSLKIRLAGGLGVGRDVPLVVALGLLYLERRKRINAEAQLAGTMSGNPTHYGHTLESAKFSPAVSTPAELHGGAVPELPIDQR
jgi:hypothetical protein